MADSRTADSQRTFIETARRAQIVAGAIDTIAEVGYAQASLGRIAAKIGISRGLISYHFAGKDELIQEIANQVIEQGKAYMESRILAQSTGSGMLRAYIESNLEFMRENPNGLIATVEISRSVAAERRRGVFGLVEIDQAVQNLENLLAAFQASGEMRGDFQPRLMAIAIRAAIDAVPGRLADPQFDIAGYAAQVAHVFDLATRVD
jgi:AcrR family transcriptional regulator